MFIKEVDLKKEARLWQENFAGIEKRRLSWEQFEKTATCYFNNIIAEAKSQNFQIHLFNKDGTPPEEKKNLFF